MRHRVLEAFATAVMATGLVACHQATTPPATADRAPPVRAKPARANDIVAWRAYMGQVADPPGATGAMRPYKFLVPTGKGAGDQRKQVQGVLGLMASNGQFPGNTIAVGGPDPVATADVLVAAFGQAKPESLRSITVLYIGDTANQERVRKVISQSGATFRFAGM